MDLFDRCRLFHDSAEYARTLGHPANPRTLEALGLYPYFIPIDQTGGTHVIIEGRRLVMAGSNNYLGLTTHPRVQEAAAGAIRRFGTACTGSRFLNGTLELHRELEARLARFVNREAALVFATGYQTNLGVVSALLRKGDVVIADREVHASLIDGIRLASGAVSLEARFFKHNDAGALDEILAAYPEAPGKLVVVDGLYSMSGRLAALPEIASACRKHGARLLVDEAHALGVLGAGMGASAQLGCADEVDLVMGTFSKSLASSGGFVAGRRDVIHWIQHYARPFMFSASLPPANAAAALAALDVIEAEPERVARVGEIAERMRLELRVRGWNVGNSHGAIVPVVIGDQFRAVQAWRFAFDRGVYVNAVLPPAVPARSAGLRTSYMATHGEEELDQVLTVFDGLRERLSRGRQLPKRSLRRISHSETPA